MVAEVQYLSPTMMQQIPLEGEGFHMVLLGTLLRIVHLHIDNLQLGHQELIQIELDAFGIVLVAAGLTDDGSVLTQE